MRVFIFGIGGTGAKVLRSLTMLLASGIRINDSSDLTLVPIIVDTDAHNGNTARTRDLLRSYYTLRRTFVGAQAASDAPSFFNTQLRSFNRLDATSSDAADLDVQLNFQNQDDTFANFIHYHGLEQQDKDVLELLYNDSLDEAPELHLNLNVGFKGNPNIGSVVFNDLKNQQQFKNLESSFTATDRVFIISSIFGGTGASGFPTLVKLIRESDNANLATTKIGAVTVMPYFNVDAEETSRIQSAIFDTKTKSALSFYAGDQHMNSIQAMYYLADKDQGGSLRNVEGGPDQLTDAHLVEFLAATAIVDFIGKKDDELLVPQCYEFGAESGGNPLTIGAFAEHTKQRYFRPLAAFAYAAKMATDLIPHMRAEAFYNGKELNIDGKLGVPSEYQKLLQFFAEFQKWSGTEMSNKDNGRAFLSFYYGDRDHLNQLLHGKPIPTGFFNKGLTQAKVAGWLTKNEDGLPKDRRKTEKYLDMLYMTAQQCLAELGQLP
ncbi:MAG: hypothetical protein V4592_08095 [Bacteroidota bacterium]